MNFNGRNRIRIFIPLLMILLCVITVHPVIQVPNQLVGVPFGKTVMLQCISEAYPKPINYWEKEEKPESTLRFLCRPDFINAIINYILVLLCYW